MNNITITAIGILLLIFMPSASNGADSYKPFVSKQYPSKEFTISQADFRHGNVLIKIIETKKIEHHEEPPHFCRAWVSVIKSDKTVYRNYFDDIEPVGFSYGLFIPKVQPPSPYFAIVKNGDYDGRLFLVRKDGKVLNLMGGFYFISKDKKYIFSEYASDGSGLSVFDLRNDRVVFASQDLPAYMHQWYENHGRYFFTASEWNDNSGMPHEKDGVAYFYDFKTNKLIEKTITAEKLAESKKVSYDFDPREYEDCKSIQNKQIQR